MDFLKDGKNRGFPLLVFAWRLVIRAKSRNAFIILTIGLMGVFSVLTSAVFEGKNAGLSQAIVNTHVGNYQLRTRAFHEGTNPFHVESLGPSLKKQLENYDYSPELILETSVLHPNGVTALKLIGIDHARHERVFPLKIPPLRNLEIVIGKKFSERLNLAVGDSFTVTYQDRSRAILTEAFTVNGIFRGFGPAFEEDFAFVSKDFLQTLMGVSEIDPFHRIVIKTQVQVHPFPPALKSENFTFVDWRDLHPELSVLMSFNDGLMNFLLICMYLVAFVSIATPVNILWDERGPELKTLFTIGGTRKVLLKIGLSEAMIVTIFSLLFTFTLFYPLFSLAEHFGIDFTYLGEGKMIKDGIELSPIVYPVLTFKHVLAVASFNILVIFGAHFLCLRKKIRSLGAEI